MSRKKVLFMVDPEVLDYLDVKAANFATRGGRGGRSEALNRIILLMRDLEPKLEEILNDG